MLFNSYVFLFVFLPFALTPFVLLSDRLGRHWLEWWVIGCSLIFYSWFDITNTAIISLSVLFNYLVAKAIHAHHNHKNTEKGPRYYFAFGVITNLAVLSYYKYTNFFLRDILSHFGIHSEVHDIALPLGISFFTFQQIIFLKDLMSKDVTLFSFRKYLFCVTFFPHLIAGPIIKYKHILKQLYSRAFFTYSPVYLATGFTWLTLGLFKKVIIADNLAPYASQAFQAVADGHVISLISSWTGCLAYAFQIYFDFSGYSDMAIGLGLLFKIELPVNFNSPYKATSIVDFWRRWHITLSWFLRECIYIPLGGNRKGRAHQYINLLITMLLAGLWHGAGWTFVVWGGVHGLLLVATHAWESTKPASIGAYSLAFARLSTFLLVCLAWVPFRAVDLQAMTTYYKSMFVITSDIGSFDPRATLIIVICCLVAWFFPNTQQIMCKFKPCIENYLSERATWTGQSFISWKPTPFYAIITVLIFCYVTISLGSNAEFLYFQF
ncbi:MBOAT family O-acyltransferase [Fundidesulfovibrio putealis]|uniref:MBOAT family O-acyltransferase n=1 Tax=Fundidesulfovibrio putealis TaxID=270496 RepID=UPI0004298F6D|nr:MBOAT family O-acyltransferase [Fundidesulfovibrio putealis]